MSKYIYRVLFKSGDNQSIEESKEKYDTHGQMRKNILIK